MDGKGSAEAAKRDVMKILIPMAFAGLLAGVASADNVHGLSDKTGRHASPGACELRGQSPADGFHVYALEWDEREAVCFYDGVRYGAFPLGEYGGAFSRPHYILLNLALGAEWMMPESEVEVDDGTRFEIDWIRVYRKVAVDPLSK